MNPFSVSPNPQPQPPVGGASPWPKVAAALALLAIAVLILVVVNTRGVDEPAAPTTTLQAGIETVPPSETVPPTTEMVQTPSSTAAGSGSVVEETCAVPAIITRGCDVRMRDGAAANGPLPVVVLLHGFMSNEDEVRSIGGWDEALLRRDFILVTPGGLAGSWNAGNCCGIAHASQVDDVGYLSELLTRISSRPDVDPNRISMVGFSNGGLMMYRYLCADAGRIQAAVSVAGTRTVDCMPSAPTPVLQVHGTADQTVPYQGGQGLVAAILGVNFAPVEATMSALAAAQQCGAEPAVDTESPITRRSWSGCVEGVTVDLWTIDGFNHDWLRTPIDSTARILDYVGID